MKIVSPPKFFMQDLLELAVVKIQQEVIPRITDEKKSLSALE